MAKILGKDPVTYAKERDGFLRELHHFHESRGTPFRRAPILSGHEIDLYLLYSLVTEQGGWIKVNSKNGWNELYEHFRVPGKCVNGSVALKQIYLRYLDRWEKVHYLGEEADRGSDDDEESRHKRWSARALHSVPLTYNYTQHNITESTRDYNHLSTDLYKASDYDRLALSLLSPLPNEQDFAINVCTLLSNDGKHTLKIERHPRIVDYLVAHAGVFSHTSMRAVFEDSYNKVRRHPINTFWNEVIESEEFLDLTNEKKYSYCAETARAVATGGTEPGIPPLSDVPAESYEKVVATEVQRTPSSGNSNLENVISDFYECCSDSDPTDERFKLRLGPTDSELFSLGRNLGTRDYIGQRVLQVATILRNLSFIDENVPILSNNRTFVRFMLLCLCSRWGPLQNLGFDMLGNISSEFQVKDPQNDRLAAHLLKIVTVGLKSEDRSSCISCLDALNKLSQNELNEDSLTRALESLVYERVCTFLTIHDVMLLIYTLECLYSLSSLGERACNYIVNNHGVIDTLVSLVTVEGKSYGPKACIGMKLVETVPGGSLANQQGTTSTVTSVSGTSSSVPATSVNTPTTVVSSISTKPGNLSNTPQRVVQMAPQRLITITPTSQSSTTPVTIQPTAGSPQATPAITPQQMVQQQHAHQQAIQENEQFALAWLRATYEPSNNGRVDHQELYKHYINSCAKIGRRGVIAPLHFPRCVRSVFGGTVGPNPVKPTVPSDPQYYDGIKARAQPLSVNVQQQQPSVTTTTNTSVAVQSPSKSIASTAKRKASTVSLSVTADCSDTPPASPASPILKAQLSAPPKPRESTVTVTTTATTTNIVVSTNTSTVVLTNKSDPKSQVMAHPHLSQALLGTGQNASSSTSGKELGTGQPNTSLIKSLLATKVTTECMTAVSMKTATDSQTVTTQVVARQQQQQQKLLLAQQTQTPESKMNKSTLIETPKGIRLNGARQLFSDSDTTESDVTSTTQNTTSNIRKEPPQPPPPPLAPLSQKPKHMRIENEDSDSTGNNSLASSTGLGNIGMGGVSSTEDGDNSLTSFEGLLNGIPSIDNPLNDDSNSKDSVKNTLKKPLMLADLLEKKVDKDTLLMNGVLGKELRKGEKSVDLVENHIKKILSKENNLNESRDQCEFIEEDTNCINVKLNENKISLKRAASDDLPTEPEAKKPLLLTNVNVNGNADSPAPDSVASSNGDDQPTEKVSTAAAKLFADMAADILEDEDVDELMQEVQQPTSTPPIPVEEPSSVVISSQSNVMSQTSSVPQVFVDGNQQVLLTQPTRQIIVSQPQIKTQTGQVIVQNPQQQRPGQIILQQANTGQILLSQGLQGPVQLVASSTQPGQYVIQTSGTQNYMVAQPQTAMVHGQPQTVLVAQTPQQQGTNTKTIIILQQPSQQQKVVVTPQGQQVVVTQVQRPILQSSSVSNNNNNQNSTSSGIIKSTTSQSTSTITTTITAEKKTEEIKVSPKPKIIRDLSTPFVCEWGDCQIETKFKSANQVYLHVCEMHVPKGSEEIMCQWDRCDNMKRKRFSLMTHLNDKHCNTEAMRASLTRRKQTQHSGKSEPASSSTVAPPHPGYAPDAAFHAIKRHALEFVNPKELQDDNEGPVTKSIRLTASLILRNLVIYSSNCRRYLKHYEPHLANVALSNVESSRTIAQVLYDMNDVSSSHR